MSDGCIEKREHALHVEERVEEGINERCCQLHEAGEILLEGGINVVVFVGRQFKVLF